MVKTMTFPRIPSRRSAMSSQPDPTMRALDRTLAGVADTGPKADPRRDRGRVAFWAFLAVLAVSIVGAIVFTQQGTQTEDQNETLRRVIQVECEPGGRFYGLPICTAVSPSVQTDAADAAAGEGLDSAAVTQLVRSELARAPDRTPTPADVEAAARRVLTANPGLYRGVQGVQGDAGQTGVPGTPGAPGAPGTAGAPGDPGPGPTDEQVRAAAQMVMAADPEAFRGDSGPQGVGLQSLTFERRDGQCVAVVTLVNPADGSTSDRTTAVGDAVCADATAPPPAPPPTGDTPPADPVDPTPEQPETSTGPTTTPSAPSGQGDGGQGLGDLLGD